MIWRRWDLQEDIICHCNKYYSWGSKTRSWTHKGVACLPGRLSVPNSNSIFYERNWYYLSPTNIYKLWQLEQCHDKSKDCYKRKHRMPYKGLSHWVCTVKNLATRRYQPVWIVVLLSFKFLLLSINLKEIINFTSLIQHYIMSSIKLALITLIFLMQHLDDRKKQQQ